MPNFFFDVLDMKSLSFDTETAMDTAEWHAENPPLSHVPEVSFSQCHAMSTLQRNYEFYNVQRDPGLRQIMIYAAKYSN